MRATDIVHDLTPYVGTLCGLSGGLTRSSTDPKETTCPACLREQTIQREQQDAEIAAENAGRVHY